MIYSVISNINIMYIVQCILCSVEYTTQKYAELCTQYVCMFVDFAMYINDRRY